MHAYLSIACIAVFAAVSYTESALFDHVLSTWLTMNPFELCCNPTSKTPLITSRPLAIGLTPGGTVAGRMVNAQDQVSLAVRVYLVTPPGDGTPSSPRAN